MRGKPGGFLIRPVRHFHSFREKDHMRTGRLLHMKENVLLLGDAERDLVILRIVSAHKHRKTVRSPETIRRGDRFLRRFLL